MSLFVFGLIFGCCGGLFCLLFCIIGLVEGEILFTLIGGGLALIFFGVGFGISIHDWKRIKHDKEILTSGMIVQGRVVDFMWGSGVRVNGRLPIDLKVECEIYGERRAYVVPSGKYSPNDYPVGCIVSLAILGTDAVLVPNSGKLI